MHRTMHSKTLSILGAIILWAAPALAQIGSVPFTFTQNTTISSSEVNTNFSTVYTRALRANGGGSISGATTVDGSGTLTFETGTTLTMASGSTFTSNVTLTATTLDLTGTGSFMRVDSDGNIGTFSWTPTTARTITFPDDTGTVIFADNTNTWSALQTHSSGLTVSTGTTTLQAVDLDGAITLASGQQISSLATNVGTHYIGTFTTNAASGLLYGRYMNATYTGASGTTSTITGTMFQDVHVMQDVAETITNVSQVTIQEPNITKNSSTITNASSLRITSAPTEATNNYAFFVDAGDTRLDGNLLINGTGPHAIGGAANTLYGLNYIGTFVPSATFGAGLRFAPTLDLGVNYDGYGVVIAPVLEEFTSGTHGNIHGLYVATLDITNAAATVNTAASLYIQGQPTEATSNYSLFVDSGDVRFDGELYIGPSAQQGADCTGATSINATNGIITSCS